MDTSLPKENGGGAKGARHKLKITAIQTGTGNPPVRLIASPQNIGTLRRRLGVQRPSPSRGAERPSSRAGSSSEKPGNCGQIVDLQL